MHTIKSLTLQTNTYYMFSLLTHLTSISTDTLAQYFSPDLDVGASTALLPLCVLVSMAVVHATLTFIQHYCDKMGRKGFSTGTLFI